VGAGGSLEATFTLTGPLPAGSWHLVGDGIVFGSVDITFDVLWRSSVGDVKVAELTHHFDPGPALGTAVPYQGDALGVAAAAHPGDQLVLRFTGGSSTMVGELYEPNSDGANTHGQIPSLTLP
jgi:hypothetical protein